THPPLILTGIKEGSDASTRVPAREFREPQHPQSPPTVYIYGNQGGLRRVYESPDQRVSGATASNDPPTIYIYGNQGGLRRVYRGQKDPYQTTYVGTSENRIPTYPQPGVITSPMNPNGGRATIPANPQGLINTILRPKNPNGVTATMLANPQGFANVIPTNPNGVTATMPANPLGFANVIPTNPNGGTATMNANPQGFVNFIPTNSNGGTATTPANPQPDIPISDKLISSNLQPGMNPSPRNPSGGIPQRCVAPTYKPGRQCMGNILRYTYNAVTQNCEKFVYGGCNPSLNNFEALEECKTICMVR
ncbi:Kunitz/Bovine pancreatic trypsin inhibitor domain protein, partial [Ancylostoma duodenale]